MAAVSAYKEALAKDGNSYPRVATVSAIIKDAGEEVYRAQAAPLPIVENVGASSEATFRTDFPDPWRAVLSPQEAAVSLSPRPSFVRFVADEKPLFQ